eukprot:c28597_g2_i1 orf=239-2698(+)
MGGSRSQKNKPHKTRFASKSYRNVHKTAAAVNGGSRGPKRPVSNAEAVRLARHTRNKNIRDQKRTAFLAEKRANTGAKSPPRVLAIVALSATADIKKVKQLLLTCALQENGKPITKHADLMETEGEGNLDNSVMTLCFPRYKLRITVLDAPRADLETCLEIAKVADAIAFVTSAVVGSSEDYVDHLGKQCLSMLKAQGLPVVTGLMLGLAELPVKRQMEVKKACALAFGAVVAKDCKVFSVDVAEDCQQVLRYFSEHRLSSPSWRNQRSFVMSQQLQFLPDAQDSESGTLQLSGYVRGRSLSVNQLVHLGGVGDFQLKQIDILEDPCPLHLCQKPSKADVMEIEEDEFCHKISRLYPDPTLQESLVIENIPDSLIGEQTWPTQQELAKARKETHRRLKKRLLPNGTSEYQTAWIIDSDNEPEEEDSGDDPMEGEIIDVLEGRADNESEGGSAISEDEFYQRFESSSVAASVKDFEEEQGEMMDEVELTVEEKQAELQRLKAAYAADQEFPDEVDTPLDVPARTRFAKFRGLKSFRTSNWDAKESLPEEYGRIFAIDNFQRTYKHALGRAREVDKGMVEGTVNAGFYVMLHIGVPAHAATKLLDTPQRFPLVVCGLLKHESKISVLHFSIKKHDSFLEPLKSKDSLVFHTGFRRFNARPIFSTDNINMDKHKAEKFLHAGRFSVASVFAPISFPPLPLVVFKHSAQGNKKTLVASGLLKSVNTDRIILKKIVLSGYPQRVSKRKAVVRFMFHNPEDVRWFKPLELWTKYGRRGRIKESVGTHGAMKCIFDGVLQQRDAVCLSLYKRVYPKWPDPLYPIIH